MVPGLLCAASQAGAQGDGWSVLDPLAPARAALLAGDLERAAHDAAGAPGLLGRVLAQKGDRAGACALYEADRASASLRGTAGSLRAARCRAEAGDVPGALAAYLETGASPLGKSPRVLDEMARFLDAQALVLPQSLLDAVDTRVGTFDVEARDAMARALAVMVRRAPPPIAEHARRRLVDELFDTVEGKKLPAPDFPTVEAALPRARAQDAAHESEALTALVTPLLKGDQPSTAACEARLLLGKAQRKLRRYAAARKQLAWVASRCTDDTRKRARFLEVKVALLGKSAGGGALAEAFVKDITDDALTDDVWFLLGEQREQQGDHLGARAAWDTIVNTLGEGDMVHEARFRSALSLAMNGDPTAAISALDAAARAASTRVDVLDRALYWRSRLRAFPRADALSPSADAAAREEGLLGLRALAQSRPASFYGHLARLGLRFAAAQAGLRDGVASDLEVGSQARARGEHSGLRPSASLRSDARFVLASALVAAGYDEEALVLLRGFSAAELQSSGVSDDLIAVAVLLGRAGASGAGHALLRSAGLALLPGRPGDDTALAWSVDWPRAYESEIVAAADAARVPRALLFGIAREESVFDAQVVSWAGAVGLCQLMVPTAKDEARDLGLPEPTVQSLRAAALNARLGAAHIGRRLRGMSHPLLAIAAYNAGPGAVARWSPAGPLDLWVERVPVEETRNYVKKVTGSWVTYSLLDGSVDDVAFDLLIR